MLHLHYSSYLTKTDESMELRETFCCNRFAKTFLIKIQMVPRKPFPTTYEATFLYIITQKRTPMSLLMEKVLRKKMISNAIMADLLLIGTSLVRLLLLQHALLGSATFFHHFTKPLNKFSVPNLPVRGFEKRR